MLAIIFAFRVNFRLLLQSKSVLKARHQNKTLLMKKNQARETF